jgi:restriction endonuclease S subunit
MKPYPKYKDSGVEWIGTVPEHWEVKKLKYASSINPTKEIALDKESDELVTFLPMENVSESGTICCDSKKPISLLWTGFTCFKKNDVIIAKITPCFENGKGALLNNLDTEIGFGSTEFHVLRAVESISPAFLFYITRTYQFRTLGEAFMTGAAGQKRVPTDFIEEFFIALPSLSEQTTIAAFLDLKTAEIDSIIAKKERLIELYEEEKAAVINHAVTKGLDPDAKMKDSGIEWLGEIPEHWEVKELKYISKIIDCKNRTPVYQDNGSFFVVRTTNVRHMKLKMEHAFFTDIDNFKEWTKRGVPEVGSILLTREAPAGEACLVPQKLPLCLGQRMMSIIPDKRKFFVRIFTISNLFRPNKKLRCNLFFWKHRDTFKGASSI